MKKLICILVLGFLFGGVASAEIAKWPSYLTKEIPVQILNKQGTPEQFLKDINQIKKQNKNVDTNIRRMPQPSQRDMITTCSQNASFCSFPSSNSSFACMCAALSLRNSA